MLRLRRPEHKNFEVKSVERELRKTLTVEFHGGDPGWLSVQEPFR